MFGEQILCCVSDTWKRVGYAVSVKKVGHFLEKVGHYRKKSRFFQVGQVLVIRRKSRAFSRKSWAFRKSLT
jgi:hypothetical protein